MLHWEEEKKNTQTQTRWKTVEERREGRCMHSGKRGGVLMKHGVRDVCACACVRVYFVCACALVCFAARQGAIGRERGPWSGWDAARPMAAHAQVMPPAHNPVTTTLARWGMPGDQQRPHPTLTLPFRPPPGTPLLRNEVIIEVDTVYAVRGGDAAEGTAGGTKEPGAEGGRGEWGAGGRRKDFPFSSFDEKEQKK